MGGGMVKLPYFGKNYMVLYQHYGSFVKHKRVYYSYFIIL